MSLIHFSCSCMFLVFAQLTESRVLILRDFDDEPLVLGHVDRSSAEEQKITHGVIISNYKPKRTHPKKTILQYGRHIYHLNNFDFNDLRSKMTQLKPNSVSYDYVDIDDLFRSSDSAIQGVGDYIKDVFIFSNTPATIQFCSGDQCDDNLRKFSKHKHHDDDDDRKHKKMQFGRIKRFQIVDRHKSTKPQSDSSEEDHEKKKPKAIKKNKKKKKKHSSESTERQSKEAVSAEKSSETRKKKKKKYEPKKSSEESVEIKRKKKKKHNEDDSADKSDEQWKNHDEPTESKEDFRKKKKKKKKKNNGKPDETKRKTLTVEDDLDDFFMQGNKIFHPNEGKKKKKHYDFDTRKRLQHFLPKRYHWEPEDIHDLGYYWFNGPKGAYSEPRQLSK